MHLFTFTQAEIQERETERYFEFLESLGLETNPEKVVGKVVLRFEGYDETLDDAIEDAWYREFALNRFGPEMHYGVVCDLTDHAFQMLSYARLQKLIVVRQGDEILYRPEALEMEAIAAYEMFAFQNFAREHKLPDALIQARCQAIEDYFLKPQGF